MLEEFGLSPHRKTIVAYTSTDELGASLSSSRCSAFRRRRVRAVLDHVRLSDSVEWSASVRMQLIVRSGQHGAGLNGTRRIATAFLEAARTIREYPGQCRHRVAEDPTSSYNVAEVADVAAVAWSNMGIELARVGVPVVAAFSGIAPYPRARLLLWPRRADYCGYRGRAALQLAVGF